MSAYRYIENRMFGAAVNILAEQHLRIGLGQ
jgi:hypothetical protein